MLGQDAFAILVEAVEAMTRSEPESNFRIEVSGVYPTDPILGKLDRYAQIPGTLMKQDAGAVASLEGGLDGWLSRRSRNFRKALRRARSRTEKEGIVFERVSPSTEDEATALYDRMLDVERRSWKGSVLSGLFSLRKFYLELLEVYARRGAARIVMAVQDGVDIGFCFGGESHGVYRGQQTSYDEDYHALSLGTQMHVETAAWLSETGVRRQHFGPLQSRTPYKTDFCEQIETSCLATFRI